MSVVTSEYRHEPVMLAECIDALDLHEGDVYLDATLGYAGHAIEAARRIGGTGTLIGIDQDAQAREAARRRLDGLDGAERPELEIMAGNFGDLDALLVQAVVPGIDAALFDLGVSSAQLDTASRGFSFKEDVALDMRMDPGNQTLTAAEILNTYNEADLARIIRDYSDERWASRIAQFIVAARKRAPIERSGQLVDIVKAAIPASARRSGGHPARRTFQALRIEVNDELDVLRRGLAAAIRWLNPCGRIVVISYHSGEDRIVKETFAQFADRCTCPADLPVCACGKVPMLEIVTHKPLLATSREIADNPRARAAKLRCALRCPDNGADAAKRRA